MHKASDGEVVVHVAAHKRRKLVVVWRALLSLNCACGLSHTKPKVTQNHDDQHYSSYVVVVVVLVLDDGRGNRRSESGMATEREGKRARRENRRGATNRRMTQTRREKRRRSY